MQLDQRASLLQAMSLQPEFEQIIHSCARDRWVLRIEHCPQVHRDQTRWNLWGKPLFGIQDGTPVMEAIHACRAHHPQHTIRVTAEKLQPAMRQVYWIHRPEPIPAARHSNNAMTVLPNQADASNEPLPPQQPLSAGNTVWRFIVLTGMLLLSALVLQETVLT